MEFGLSLHAILAIFFAVHAIRSGRPWYWLLILFLFPLLGSIVYLFVEFLPDLRGRRSATRVVLQAVAVLDPGHELRAADAAFTETPSVQNRIRRANALLGNGRSAEAVAEYDICLATHFANDPEVCLEAARARLMNGDCAGCAQLMDGVRAQHPHFRPDEVQLLLARALAGAARGAEAEALFRDALARFGSVEAKAEYAIFAATRGDLKTAHSLRDELGQRWKNWPSHTRALPRALFERMDRALAAAR